MSMRGWRIAVFIAALVPIIWWAYQVAANQAGPEPGRFLLLNFGQGGLILLLLTLSLTPLTRLTRWRGFNQIRRQLGLWTYSYALLHVTSYVLFILGLDLSMLAAELVKRPYIIVGAAALLGLTALALTSNRFSMRRLGKRWKTLHKAAYAILALILVHFLWVVRADMGEWSLYAAIAAGLMLLRLPRIAKTLPRLHKRFARSRYRATPSR